MVVQVTLVDGEAQHAHITVTYVSLNSFSQSCVKQYYNVLSEITVITKPYLVNSFQRLTISSVIKCFGIFHSWERTNV